jgi:hypothetical protein
LETELAEQETHIKEAEDSNVQIDSKVMMEVEQQAKHVVSRAENDLERSMA